MNNPEDVRRMIAQFSAERELTVTTRHIDDLKSTLGRVQLGVAIVLALLISTYGMGTWLVWRLMDAVIRETAGR